MEIELSIKVRPVFCDGTRAYRVYVTLPGERFSEVAGLVGHSRTSAEELEIKSLERARTYLSCKYGAQFAAHALVYAR